MSLPVQLAPGSSFLIPNAGLQLLNGALRNLDICSYGFLNNMSHTSRWISNGEIVKSSILLQCLGKTNYADISSINGDPLYKNIFERNVSPETFRQRLNEISENDQFFSKVDSSNTTLLKKASFTHVTYHGEEYIPLDIDVTPFLNPDAHKECIDYTYKKVDGFAPIMAYLGSYAICFDLRPGNQHSEDGAIDFLLRCIEIVKKLGIDLSKVLVRLDSAHDAAALILILDDLGVKYIIKRNLRREDMSDTIVHSKKNATPMLSSDTKNFLYRVAFPDRKPTNAPNSQAFAIFEVADPIKDKNGIDQYRLLRVTDPNDPNFGRDGIPYEVSSWWTNLPIYESSNPAISKDRDFVTEVIELYKDHATSEQYHSELKTDMNMELLPSHYFATNKAYLALAVIAFNLLRLLGDGALKIDSSFQHHKNVAIQRIRVGTVIKKICLLPCKVVAHARKLVLQLSKDCQMYNTFSQLWQIWC